jgi:D-tyrosyl-tRNA(Tyr) deacylase
MRVVIQRVSTASVTINKKEVRHIGLGLVVLLGIEDGDSSSDIDWLCGKISRLRIFDDAQGVMNCSLLEVQGSVLLISQFTLHASTKKGNRPSYIRASRPETAIPLYEEFIVKLSLEIKQKPVTGEFGAHMDVALVNDGPVTIIMDSKNRE